ncbi:proteinase-activated receptor 2-like [Pygocentrus nattereri]|uniref:G-protein coupled receptors family 1 profile domain-containing protein n=1 Tax=Pygocentrus nattereri TaxID=42514 RepID=A0A3B4CC37_PYGNA|nr:proteinase-activated receptor 2-like [Pygocentrus nattereri]
MPDNNFTGVIQAGFDIIHDNKDSVNHSVTVTNTSMKALHSSLTTIFIPTVYIFIFIVGLPTNAMALWVFLFRTKKKHPSSILMANRALADLLFIVWLPLKIIYHFNGNDWTFGEPLCKVLVGFFYGNMYCSAIFIACISAQRYWAIVHPLSQKLSSRVTVCVCVCVWIVVWVLTVPLYLYDQTVKVNNLDITTCHDIIRSNQTYIPVGYFLTMGTVGYVVPCVVCIVSYLLTFLSLRRSITDSSRSKKKRKAIVLMVTVLVMFLVCFTPSNIMLMVHYSLLGAKIPNNVYVIYIVALCLGSLNSCLDPFVYYYISEEFRGYVRNALMCHHPLTEPMSVSYSAVKTYTNSLTPPTNTTSSSTPTSSPTSTPIPALKVYN